MQPITIHNSQPIGAEINSADARELHSFLNSERQYANWIQDRITQYGFIENQDYIVKTTYTGRRPRKEYFVTLDMAKELCMVENNDKGKEARRYFIKCEKELQAIKFEAYVNKIAELDAVLIDKTKRHRREISGYKGKLTQANNQIAIMRDKLKIFDDPRFKPITSDHPSYFQLWCDNIDIAGNRNAWRVGYEGLKSQNEKLKTKNDEIVANLLKIQKELERSYTAIGAVVAFAHDDDRFFMKRSEILS